MKSKFAVPMLIVASVGLSSAAMAASPMSAQNDVGVITKLDLKAMKVTLSDGNTFQMPGGYALEVFNLGETVNVGWVQVGGTKVGYGITFAN